MNNIPDDLIFEIYTFLPNYDVLNFYKINERFSKLFNEYDLMLHSLNRDHPIVFNACDNYCYKCNLKLSIITFDKEFTHISCKHF